MIIIDIYIKTEYLLADFFYESLPSEEDDSIFKEMLKRINVHYMA